MTEELKVRVVAGVMVKQADKYLLVQEGQPKAYGLWNWPAGGVEIGATAEETAIREAKEEAGIDVQITGKVGLWHDDIATPVLHLFTAEMVGGELAPAEGEILAVEWFTKEQILEMKDKMRASWIIEAIERMG